MRTVPAASSSCAAPHSARWRWPRGSSCWRAVQRATEGRPAPVNAALRPFDPDDEDAAARLVASLLELAARDASSVAHRKARRRGPASARIVVPCIDWSLSGVNTALEAVG